MHQNLKTFLNRRCYMMMKMSDWLNLLRVAMVDLTIIEAPSEVGTTGRFQELLIEFLTNRARGERKEDLLSGRPFEDTEAGRHYFRLKDLQKFLRREDMRDFSRPQITQRIHNMGGTHAQFDVKGHNVHCWYVPSNIIETLPVLDVPMVKGAPV